MPKMYLLRHCDYDNPRTILPGRLPVELSEQGKRRAQELQQFFADKEIAAIYSSAVLRCRQTVEIIADKKIPIFYDARLLETLSAYQGYWGEN
jgi:broad specificity phosphatase PhoE